MKELPYKRELKELYGETNADCLNRLATIITPHTANIAMSFMGILIIKKILLT